MVFSKNARITIFFYLFFVCLCVRHWPILSSVPVWLRGYRRSNNHFFSVSSLIVRLNQRYSPFISKVYKWKLLIALSSYHLSSVRRIAWLDRYLNYHFLVNLLCVVNQLQFESEIICDYSSLFCLFCNIASVSILVRSVLRTIHLFIVTAIQCIRLLFYWRR